MVYRRGCMRGRRWLFAGWVAFAGLMLATAPLVAMAQASPEATATQSSSEQGVTVKVTPNSGSTGRANPLPGLFAGNSDSH